MINKGKAFEQDIKKSIPDWCWCYRFKDSAGTWQGGDNTRFTPSNICDFMVMAKDTLFLLELKSHQGVSIPFSCIRSNQIKEMSTVNHPSIRAIFILNFRDRERTYAVEAKKLKEFIEITTRKSIPIKWALENGLEIPGQKKRVRFRYNLESLFRGGVNE